MDDQTTYERLFQEGRLFDFFQAVWLLEQRNKKTPGPGESPGGQRIRFRPDTSLVFPSSDIKRVEKRDDHTLVTVTFMGLYGVNAPLPAYFYNAVEMEPDPERSPLREFLDIFNNRFYAFFYRAWKKYRPIFGYRQRGQDVHTKRFLALAGLYPLHAQEPSATPVSPLQLAAFAGRLIGRVRNADGLRALLMDVLSGIPVEIIQNVPRWVPLPQRPRLGGGGAGKLGGTVVLGKQVCDITGKFRVRIGPMDANSYLALLPGKEKARVVQELVRLYVPDHLGFDVELVLNTEGLEPLRLGGRSPNDTTLGQMAFVGRQPAPNFARLVSYT